MMRILAMVLLIGTSTFANAEIVDLDINVVSSAGHDSALAESVQANASCLSPSAWLSGDRAVAKQQSLKNADQTAESKCSDLNGVIKQKSKASTHCECNTRYIHIFYLCRTTLTAQCEIN